MDSILQPKQEISIAMVGKYVDLHDAYLSVKEALFHAGALHGASVDIQWIPAEEIERDGPERYLQSVCGIVVPVSYTHLTLPTSDLV